MFGAQAISGATNISCKAFQHTEQLQQAEGAVQSIWLRFHHKMITNQKGTYAEIQTEMKTAKSGNFEWLILNTKQLHIALHQKSSRMKDISTSTSTNEKKTEEATSEEVRTVSTIATGNPEQSLAPIYKGMQTATADGGSSKLAFYQYFAQSTSPLHCACKVDTLLIGDGLPTLRHVAEYINPQLICNITRQLFQGARTSIKRTGASASPTETLLSTGSSAWITATIDINADLCCFVEEIYPNSNNNSSSSNSSGRTSNNHNSTELLFRRTLPTTIHSQSSNDRSTTLLNVVLKFIGAINPILLLQYDGTLLLLDVINNGAIMKEFSNVGAYLCAPLFHPLQLQLWIIPHTSVVQIKLQYLQGGSVSNASQLYIENKTSDTLEEPVALSLSNWFVYELPLTRAQLLNLQSSGHSHADYSDCGINKQAFKCRSMDAKGLWREG